jgi:hypothetical protein
VKYGIWWLSTQRVVAAEMEMEEITLGKIGYQKIYLSEARSHKFE